MVMKSVLQLKKSLLPAGDPGAMVHCRSMLVVQFWKKSTPLRVTFLSTGEGGGPSGVGVVTDRLRGGVVSP